MPEQIPECTTTAWEKKQKQPFGNIDNNNNNKNNRREVGGGKETSKMKLLLSSRFSASAMEKQEWISRPVDYNKYLR